MQRYLYSKLLQDLPKKMVVLTGPRQIGKTTLAKQLVTEFTHPIYLNFDDPADKQIIQKRYWPLNTDFLVFDEIHKQKNWKVYLKGVFDTRQDKQTILVTGSARLDTFRQSGESLAGRYFHYRLHPLSVRELKDQIEPYECINQLNYFGGFPEPFLANSEETSDRWRKQYYTDLVREDILDFSKIHEIKTIQLLLEMLRERVGSPLSYLSLSRDLQVSPNTIKNYVNILESLYIIFLIRPYYKNIARSILHEPKVYFYDSGYVKADDGIKLENTCAVCLQKHAHFLQDSKGKDIVLNYLRTKEGKEVDFVLAVDGELDTLIEIKLSDISPSKSLQYFANHFPITKAVQLVHNCRKPQQLNNLEIVPAGEWLANLEA